MTATDCRMTRRSILIGAAASLTCAPAIVQFTNLMPVRRLPLPDLTPYGEFLRRSFYRSLKRDLKTGQMSLVCNGDIVSEAEALCMVAHARAQGWLAKPALDLQVHRFRRCLRQSQGISKLPDQILIRPSRAASSLAT
jgi:hypothetical protein